MGDAAGASARILAAHLARCVGGGGAVTFSRDTSNRTLETLAEGSDLLIAHNAVREDTGAVALNLNMPPSEIGRTAAAANVRKRVLSHRMNRTLGREDDTLEHIRAHYRGPATFAADLGRIDP